MQEFDQTGTCSRRQNPGRYNEQEEQHEDEILKAPRVINFSPASPPFEEGECQIDGEAKSQNYVEPVKPWDCSAANGESVLKNQRDQNQKSHHPNPRASNATKDRSRACREYQFGLFRDVFHRASTLVAMRQSTYAMHQATDPLIFVHTMIRAPTVASCRNATQTGITGKSFRPPRSRRSPFQCADEVS